MSEKITTILLLVLFVLMLALTGGLYMVWSKLSGFITHYEEANSGQLAASAETNEVGVIYSLETFVVNLADQGGKRYLRVTMDLELNGDTAKEDVAKRLPQVRDKILMILPSKQFSEINSMNGKMALRDEIMASLNELFGRPIISNVFFSEFVVQ